MLLDRHHGFMHIARVAQSCRLDNQAKFVPSHHESIKSIKKVYMKKNFWVSPLSKSTISETDEDNLVFAIVVFHVMAHTDESCDNMKMDGSW